MPQLVSNKQTTQRLIDILEFLPHVKIEEPLAPATPLKTVHRLRNRRYNAHSTRLTLHKRAFHSSIHFSLEPIDRYISKKRKPITCRIGSNGLKRLVKHRASKTNENAR